MENGIFYRQMMLEKVSLKQKVKDVIKEDLQEKYLQKIDYAFELKFREYKAVFDSMVWAFKQNKGDDFQYEYECLGEEEIPFVERIAHDVKQIIGQQHLFIIGIKVNRANNKISLYVKEPLPVFCNDLFA